MIIDTLARSDRYAALHPRFAAAFQFLRHTDLTALPAGRHDIDDDRLFAIVAKTNGRARTDAKLECHRKYIDIQYVIAGIDEMGWKPAGACTLPQNDYSEERDIQFFDDAPCSWIAAPAGTYCIFFPHDAHAPLVSEGPIHKIVMKVAV